MTLSHDSPRPRTRWFVLLGVVAVAAVGAALASAVLAGGGGVVTACVHKTTGAVRIVDPAVSACKKTETQMQWNTAGVTGPPGGGTVYADRFIDDYPGGPPGFTLPRDAFVSILALDMPDEWGADPQTVVTASLNVANNNDFQISLNCAANGPGTNFVWAIDANTRDTISYTAYGTGPRVELSCLTSQGSGPPETGWDVQLWRATLAASQADSILHYGNLP
jgi:hypothetical protein